MRSGVPGHFAASQAAGGPATASRDCQPHGGSRCCSCQSGCGCLRWESKILNGRICCTSVELPYGASSHLMVTDCGQNNFLLHFPVTQRFCLAADFRPSPDNVEAFVAVIDRRSITFTPFEMKRCSDALALIRSRQRPPREEQRLAAVELARPMKRT